MNLKPVPWLPWNTYGYPMVEGDPWAVLKSGVDKFDKEMCEAWNGELDTILTFVRSQIPCPTCHLDELITLPRLVCSPQLLQLFASNPSSPYPEALPTRPTYY